MVELTGIKRNGGIYTYSYSAAPPGNAAKAGEGDSFEKCLNNAANTANTADKASKSEYSREEQEAQKVKNQAIGELMKLDGQYAKMYRRQAMNYLSIEEEGEVIV